MSAVLALLSSLVWGGSDFLGGTVTRRLPGPSVVGVSQLVALLALVPLAAVTGALDSPRTYVAPGVLAGLVGSTALLAFYRALAAGTMGVVAPIAALGVLLPVGVGLVRGEAPTAVQVVGIAVAVVGVVLASGPELSGRAGARPVVFALVAAAGFGVVIALIAQGSRGGLGTVLMTLVTMRLTSVLGLTAMLVMTAPTRGWELGVVRRDLPLLALIGVGDAGANYLYGLASRGDLLSVVAVLGSLYPVVTVLLAWRLQHERLRRVQALGVAATLLGVALLAGG